MIVSQVIGGEAASPRSARSLASIMSICSNLSRRSCAHRSHSARDRARSIDHPSAPAWRMHSCKVAPCAAYLLMPHESHLHKSNCRTSVTAFTPFVPMLSMCAASPPAVACRSPLAAALPRRTARQLVRTHVPIIHDCFFPSRALRALVGSRRGLPLAACKAAALPRRKRNSVLSSSLWCELPKPRT